MKKKWFAVVLICAVVLIVVLCIAMNKIEQHAVSTEKPTPKTTSALEPTVMPTEDPCMVIELAHDTFVRIPKELSDSLIHEQEIHEALVTEVFSMKIGDTIQTLYRIDFGDEQAGDWLGRLVTDEGDIPVTYTVFVVSEEELTALGDEIAEMYYALLDTFNMTIESIAADSRFTAEKALALGEDKESKMKYWTVTLPGNMGWSETNENGEYQAIFYGSVGGERVALYTVRIGDVEAATVLGQFKVDGGDKIVSVESFDIAEHSGWTEDDYSVAYRMMDTINHVIETIMSSEQFSIPDEELVQASDVAQ